ncbi:hypothetical protein OSTOST_16503, partial [Ostertagia ostertagi]
PYVIEVEKKQTGCVICAAQHAADGFRTSSTSKVQNAIIIASLLASGYNMKMNVKATYDNCNASRKNMCHRHYVAAADGFATERDICQFMNGSIRRYHATPLWPLEQTSNSQSGCSEKTASQLPKKAENSQSLCTDNEERISSGRSHPPDNVCVPSVKITMGRPIYAVRVSAVPVTTNAHEHQYSHPYMSQSSSNGMVPCVRLLGEPQLTAVRLLEQLW